MTPARLRHCPQAIGSAGFGDPALHPKLDAARASEHSAAMDRFAGKIVWVTGASSGIGEALARGFAAEGARLVLSSRRLEELERVRRSLPRADEHVSLPLDLAQAATFPALAAQVLQKFGRVDILVNNGGVSQRALAADMQLDVERAMMEVNYFGTVALTKAVLPSMLARGAGHVVVVSSVMGYVGVPGRSTYAASKHALHGYFDTLRAEVHAAGVKVTLVCPGYVLTRVSANALGARGEKHGVTDATHERGISAERCAAVTLRAIARGKDEISVGGIETWAITLKRFLPGVYARVIRRMKFGGKK
jgi:short-subunit dehydrogenase